MDFIILFCTNLLFIIFIRASKPKIKSMSFIFLIYILINSYFISQRSSLLPDTAAYEFFYKSLTFDFQLELNNWYFEDGFIIFSILIKFIFGNDYRLYFFAIAFISLFFLFKIMLFFFKDIKNPIIQILFTVFIYTFTLSFSWLFISIRIGLAFFIGFYGFLLIKESPIRSIILLLIGISFHNSLLILFFAIPFYYLTTPSKLINFFVPLVPIFLYIGLTNSLFLFINNLFISFPFIYDRFYAYLNLNSILVVGTGSLLRIFFLFVITLLLLNSKIIVESYYSFILIFLIGYFLRLILIDYNIIYRVEELFIFSALILLQKEPKYKQLNLASSFKFIIYLYFLISNIRMID
jgi:hypothetical protein